MALESHSASEISGKKRARNRREDLAVGLVRAHRGRAVSLIWGLVRHLASLVSEQAGQEPASARQRTPVNEIGDVRFRP